ncbi:MAG: signal peptidase II [Rickettsiales bacterium]|jgi:signal peptidase II|nr:signal peptidase II [Rickettsiales bacterium]
MKYITKANICYYLASIILMVILDLASKYLVFNYLTSTATRQVEILPIFNFVMVWNRGISFGMLNNIPNAPLVLTIIAFLIVLFLLRWLLTTESKYIAISLTFIISGAFGNIIDRVINGAVADFLDFHIAGYHWPAFNLADSFVTIGAILLIFEDLFFKIYKCYKK